MSHPREWHPRNARDDGPADRVGARMHGNLWQTRKTNVEAAHGHLPAASVALGGSAIMGGAKQTKRCACDRPVVEGSTRRAIDIREDDAIDEPALRALIHAAVALNTSARSAARSTRFKK